MTSPQLDRTLGAAVEQLIPAERFASLGGVQLRQGTISAVDGPTATVTVALSGDTELSAGVHILAGYLPTVGDTVWILKNGSDMLVLGLQGSTRQVTAWDVSAVGPGAGETQTATTYQDLAPSITFAIVKHVDASDLLVFLATSVYVTGATADPYFGVNINGVDYEVAHYSNNIIDTEHTPFSGCNLISGVPAGSYTVTVRWKRGAGTGTLNRNGFDRIKVSVQEVN